MQLKERVEKYRDIEKGPRRCFQKKIIGGTVVYCCPNGIGVYEGTADVPCETVIERGEYTVIRLKRESKEH